MALSEHETVSDRGPSDPRTVFATLAKQGVDFVVIGG